MVNKNHDSATPASLRRTHRGMALALAQRFEGISRVEIARSLGFSEMAATRIVRELLDVGILEEIAAEPARDAAPSRRLGRPKIGLRVRGEGLFAAGITVSAYHSDVSICDANGEIVARRTIPYLVEDDIAGTARAYGRHLNDLIEASGIDARKIVGVGVALAARTLPDENVIVRSDYFGWGHDDGAFHEGLRSVVDLPVRIDNIANALAIGEMRFGLAREIGDFVLIHVATVIGAAIMTGGRLVRGWNGIAGMIGHMQSEPAAHRCMCGRTDCLNLNATGFGILSGLGLVETGAFEPDHLQDYATRLLDVIESPEGPGLMREAGRRLAPGIDAIRKLLGPETVILSGYVGANPAFVEGVNGANLRAPDAPQAVAGSIAPTQAAALLALTAFCYSDNLDFERFVAIAAGARSSGKG